MKINMDDDDIIIEDELESDAAFTTEYSTTTFHRILQNPWILWSAIGIVCWIILTIYRLWRKSTAAIYRTAVSEEESRQRYEEMKRARDRQQMQYEEQRRIKAEKEKQRLAEMADAAEQNTKKMKYRTDDFNPLTGRSNMSSRDSCSWRPSSSRRRPATGG